MKEYDPSLFDTIVSGVPLGGPGEGGIAKITPSGPSATIKMGVKGDVARSAQPITLQVDIILMSTSQSNAFLFGLFAAGNGPFSILLVDRNGASVMACDSCWIEKLPDVERGKEASDYTWTLRTDSNFKWIETGSA